MASIRGGKVATESGIQVVVLECPGQATNEEIVSYFVGEIDTLRCTKPKGAVMVLWLTTERQLDQKDAEAILQEVTSSARVMGAKVTHSSCEDDTDYGGSRIAITVIL